MKAGAFSDKGVGEASQKIIPVYIDCTKSTPPDLKDKYSVTGYPTIVFVDGEENVIEALKARDAQNVITQMNDISAKHPMFAGWGADLEGAVKAGDKPIVIGFVDGSDKSFAMLSAFSAEELKEVREGFAMVRVDYDPDNPDAFKDIMKKYGASKAPTVLIFDPATMENEKPKSLKKYTSPKTGKALAKELEKVLEDWKAGHGD